MEQESFDPTPPSDELAELARALNDGELKDEIDEATDFDPDLAV